MSTISCSPLRSTMFSMRRCSAVTDSAESSVSSSMYPRTLASGPRNSRETSARKSFLARSSTPSRSTIWFCNAYATRVIERAPDLAGEALHERDLAVVPRSRVALHARDDDAGHLRADDERVLQRRTHAQFVERDPLLDAEARVVERVVDHHRVLVVGHADQVQQRQQLVAGRDRDERADLFRAPPFRCEPGDTPVDQPDVHAIDVERRADHFDRAHHDVLDVERRVHDLGELAADALILGAFELDQPQPGELAGP